MIEVPVTESPDTDSTRAATIRAGSTRADAGGLIRRRNAEVSSSLRGSHIHPLLQQVYANRGIHTLDEVEYGLDQLLDYHLLKDIEKAAAAVCDAINAGNQITVVGDFDADGATSCAVVIRSLRSFGFDNVDYLVPNRFDFGYGLSPEIVDVAVNQLSKPDLIITVDNGISSISGVSRANASAIDVVVTDHHLAGDELPAAVAIVNPNQPGCAFPEKSIAGVGVAFYLMLAVRARLRQTGWFDSKQMAEPNMACLLDLVALGTVADVVPLEKNNRVLVAAGVDRIRSGRACAGIRALCSVAGRDPARCTTQDFGFAVAPRLNAAGRLDDMAIGIECLLCDDDEQAMLYASQLDAINRRRREIESDMLDGALATLDKGRQLQAAERMPALTLYEYDWHQGVVGLIASRIKERLHRPVIAFARASEDDDSDDVELKGSARSIPGVHIRDVLDAIDRKHPIIDKFGGHAMAAGLSIRQSRLDAFRLAFEEEVASLLRPEFMEDVVCSDGAIAEQYLTLEVAETLRYAAPWGQKFEEPLFDGVFLISNWRIVGDRHLKLDLVVEGSGLMLSAIAFNHTDADLPAGHERIHIAYRLDVNEYRGNRSLQLIVQKISPVD